ncbi:transcriptional regulator MntR [Candidatus Nitrosocosmicus sp. SS]|uniref:transcriptional regulator MntR n=1 Tax=Candidatus Nitrosocosmicus agrestis TaxID=2563600 RepID=UPI001E4CD9E2|nr:transcriptional regulator MntR [Candidatus Nitrosocosmicus sp. SS]
MTQIFNMFLQGNKSINTKKELFNTQIKPFYLSIDDYDSKKKRESSESRLDFIRNAHNEKKEGEIRTDRMEDYLEVIYELIQQKGYATTADISKYLNVSSPSVTKMVKKLDENQYLIYEKYRGLRLTIDGINIAKNIREKHSLFAEFLKMIGVEDDVAHLDAEGIEHHLHAQTIEKLENLIILLKKMNPDILKEL